jgi:hypothetical protein
VVSALLKGVIHSHDLSLLPVWYITMRLIGIC